MNEFLEVGKKLLDATDLIEKLQKENNELKEFIAVRKNKIIDNRVAYQCEEDSYKKVETQKSDILRQFESAENNIKANKKDIY